MFLWAAGCLGHRYAFSEVLIAGSICVNTACQCGGLVSVGRWRAVGVSECGEVESSGEGVSECGEVESSGG